MTTWLTTYERELRERLLNVIHAQWRDLGVAFSAAAPVSDEVIDPEALLWCSLEFLPTEPRLREGVVGWLEAHENQILHQRVNRRAAGEGHRAGLWRALIGAKQTDSEAPTADCDQEDSRKELTKFRRILAAHHARSRRGGHEVGEAESRPSAALLGARDLLGGDQRHFLLVYLLAIPSGGRLKNVQRWSGYSYRSLWETARRWEAAKVVVIDHGYCHLTHPEPWRALLRHGSERAVIVDWFSAFDACIRLLRGLARAGRKGLSPESAVVESLCREAEEALSQASLSEPGKRAPGVEYLREAVAKAGAGVG